MDRDALEIARLAADEVDEAAELLARALRDNPMHSAVFREHGAAALRCQREMFGVILREFPGVKLAARDGGSVVGVLRSVHSPLCRLPPAEARRLGPRLTAILGEAAPRVTEWFRVWAEHDPSESHWHLGPVAVAVERQGLGIGSALLGRFCEMVDTAGEPAHLETDTADNVRLYERFGFAVRERIEICGVGNYFMWRAAR